MAACISDELYVINTDGKLNFSKASWTISQEYFLFELQACADAQIILSNAPRETTRNAYKIILGDYGNRKTAISKIPPDPTLDVSVDTLDILNCSAMLEFWVKTTPTTITVGKGKFGENVIGTLKDAAMMVLHGVAVATGSAVKGVFVVPKSNGKFTPDHQYKQGR